MRSRRPSWAERLVLQVAQAGEHKLSLLCSTAMRPKEGLELVIPPKISGVQK